MNKIIRTICRSFTMAGSVFVLALALALSTAQANSDYIVYQWVAFDEGTAVADSNIAFKFIMVAVHGTIHQAYGGENNEIMA